LFLQGARAGTYKPRMWFERAMSGVSRLFTSRG
jgi:hypothetical protein